MVVVDQVLQELNHPRDVGNYARFPAGVSTHVNLRSRSIGGDERGNSWLEVLHQTATTPQMVKKRELLIRTAANSNRIPSLLQKRTLVKGEPKKGRPA